MSATKVQVETSDPAPHPQPVIRCPSISREAWEVFERLFLSRQVWGTALACWYLWADHWADTAILPSMTEPAQLQAFTTITVNKNDTMKWVILGFLGFTTAGSIMGVGSSVVNRFTQTTTQRTGIQNRNTRADRDE